MQASRIQAFKTKTPWFLKIAAKILLSRIPVSAKRWQQLNLFRAGVMDDPELAFQVFRKHLNGAGYDDLSGMTVLELGPGNSALTALFAHAFGATRTWLVDAEELASQDAAIFERAEKMLVNRGFPKIGLAPIPSVSAALKITHAEYLTDGLGSLRRIGDSQVDFLFSNAVLEHIRLADFVPLVHEMRRVLKPKGVASHQIDFRDHLDESLNNLRFSARVWESDFMARSGFYTNRLPWAVMKQMFEEAGFSIKLVAVENWPNGLPTPLSKMAVPFKKMPVDELMVMGVHVLLTRK